MSLQNALLSSGGGKNLGEGGGERELGTDHIKINRRAPVVWAECLSPHIQVTFYTHECARPNSFSH